MKKLKSYFTFFMVVLLLGIGTTAFAGATYIEEITQSVTLVVGESYSGTVSAGVSGASSVVVSSALSTTDAITFTKITTNSSKTSVAFTCTATSPGETTISPYVTSVKYPSTNYTIREYCVKITVLSPTFKVLFEPNGGRCNVSNQKIEYKQRYSYYSFLPVPTRAGYNFAGWYDSSNNQITDSTIFNQKNNMVLYAKWTPILSNVWFDTGIADTAYEYKTVSFDLPFGELPVPTKYGYDFAGWFTDRTYGTQITSDSIVKTVDDLILYAHWTPKRITGLTLNKASLTLTKGKSEQLISAITPSDAVTDNLIWHSSDKSVATVSDGLITAISPGTATITVSTTNGSQSATCSVTVVKPSGNPSISASDAKIDVTLEGDTDAGIIYAAIYDINNRFIYAKVYPASESISVELTPAQNGAYAKIMWWNNMLPVCEAQNISL